MAQREMVLNITLLGIPASALLAALAYRFGGWGPDWSAALAWSALPALVVLVYDSLRALRQKRMGVDILAMLSILVALLMGERATAAVIAAMVASGRLLESYAAGRAAREMEALLQKVPRMAHRLDGEQLQTVPANVILPGDTLLVKQGEMVPVDGPLSSPAASLDESSLTGEALPILQTAGDLLRSGALNAGDTFRMIAAKSAADSTFSAIVKLVEQAAAAKSPATRMADRYALWFIPLTLGLAWMAWLISGDPVRALAVLVVATPCPLLLAVPVAQVSGISRCAGRGVLVKGGAALESLAQADTLFFDKTGTLTGGQAKLIGIRGHGRHEAGELLRLVASLDQMSCHVLAAAILHAAHERGLTELPLPEQVEETAGAGICGRVDGRLVAAGTSAFIIRQAASEP
ncbi:HAD-IC family P-type ATPase [Chromobacterium sphagni]|uniref:HAD-IC family P-type ATPase n=1 Tax=Chromobacterium sphagni TaxID=1903179 RepID=UPI000A4BC269|nr:HAD-IC family P-type ATPase [Chromobacterium sphagni]